MARYTAYYNTHSFIVSNPFFEVRPHKGVDALDLTAILNSSLTMLMLEFSGRYRENRDRTISNQIAVDDMENLLIIDPRKLSQEKSDLLKKNVKKIMTFKQSSDGIINEADIKERRALDETVFIDILNLKHSDMEDAIEGLSSCVKRRLSHGINHVNDEDD